MDRDEAEVGQHLLSVRAADLQLASRRPVKLGQHLDAAQRQ
jgi:hypothetical protein